MASPEASSPLKQLVAGAGLLGVLLVFGSSIVSRAEAAAEKQVTAQIAGLQEQVRHLREDTKYLRGKVDDVLKAVQPAVPPRREDEVPGPVPLPGRVRRQHAR